MTRNMTRIGRSVAIAVLLGVRPAAAQETPSQDSAADVRVDSALEATILHFFEVKEVGQTVIMRVDPLPARRPHLDAFP